MVVQVEGRLNEGQHCALSGLSKWSEGSMRDSIVHCTLSGLSKWREGSIRDSIVHCRGCPSGAKAQ